jgi:hypothetical protein
MKLLTAIKKFVYLSEEEKRTTRAEFGEPIHLFFVSFLDPAWVSHKQLSWLVVTKKKKLDRSK